MATTASRADTPVLRPTKRGSTQVAVAGVKTAEDKQMALENYERDKFARSTAMTRDHLLATWTYFFVQWFGALGSWLPLTVEGIAKVAAMFKLGRFRSYPNYLSRAKEAHITEGYAWTSDLALEARHSTASVLRGIDPPCQSAPFGVGRVLAVPAHALSRVNGAPWLTRRVAG